MSVRITCVVDAQAEAGEGPLWDPVEGVLWWTDIRGKRVHRYDPRTGHDEVFPLPIRVGCLALRESGGSVLAAEHGFWFWRPDTGVLEHVLDVEADRPHNRMNDGACDRQGRLVAASMNTQTQRRPTAACWRLDADLKAERLADDLLVGNGIAFSPAGDRFHLADTGADRVWVHDYDGATGAVGAPRVFIDTTGLAGRPDGAVFDTEGGYWLAGVTGSQLYRIQRLARSRHRCADLQADPSDVRRAAPRPALPHLDQRGRRGAVRWVVPHRRNRRPRPA